MATLLESDEEKYNNIGFATFPSIEGAKGDTNVQNIGLGYGMAINSKVAEDPETVAKDTQAAYESNY